MKKLIALIAGFLLIPSLCLAAPATYYVTPAGAGTKDGSTWAKAMGYAEWKADITTSAEAGDIYYMAGGTYTLDADLNGSALVGTAVAPIKIIGVKSGTTAEPPTFSDWAFGTDRPYWDGTGGYSFYTPQYCIISNIRHTSSDGTATLRLSTASLAVNYKAVNSSSGRGIYSNSDYAGAVNCEVSSASGSAIDLGNYGKIIGCYIHDSTTGINSNIRTLISGNIIDTCTTGINLGANYHIVILSNVIYGCTTGIAGTSAYHIIALNNIIDTNTAGASWTTATPENYWDYNAWGANGTDVSNVTKGNSDLTSASSYLGASASSGDFTLPASSPLLGVGLGSTMPGATGDYNWNIGVDQGDHVTAGGGNVLIMEDD